jgi:hypothetical protein
MTLALALSLAPGLLHAQFNFKLADRDVQIHSFATQGYMYSNQNNYMSMPTSKGSFAFTDGGANISSQITDKFRVGAQIYLRNVGEFGNWKPELDWAYGSYKFNSWFGIKAGKVKTVLGLFNDVQDMDSVHTFALLPQAIYPTDWRSTTIAHSGGDVFGDIAIKHMGTFSYTGYAGTQPVDLTSGYDLAAKAVGVTYTYHGGREVGGDLRWTMPFGALVGASYLDTDLSADGSRQAGGVTNPYKQNTTANGLAQYYGQYAIKGFRIDVEYRRNLRDMNLYFTPTTVLKSIVDSRGWYVAGTYRVTKHLELGAYRSVYLVDDRKPVEPPAQHESDTVISGRVDLTNHWYVKVEGHFIDGNPTTNSAARGFYGFSNLAPITPTTNLIAIRTGLTF